MKGFGGGYDAIVIGASAGGLAAAALLAQAGRRTLVLEREAAPPEPIGPVYAFDPTLMTALKLPARGLHYVERDLPLALPGPDGGHLFLGRDHHQTAQALRPYHPADSQSWPRFRRELHNLARALRRWWWSAMEEGAPDWVLDNNRAKARFARLCVTGADAFLASYFQSETVVAALLFDAGLGGFHISEPGSALALVWRAAQEMGGLEGAAAIFAPGSLAWSLIKAAGGSDFRCCTRVTGLQVRNGAVAGVKLADGEEIAAPLVFSALAEAQTMALAGAASPGLGLGEARLLFRLAEALAFPQARLVLAERPGLYADAHEAARAGRLPAELPMEFTAAAADRIAVTMRPVPLPLDREARIQLAARAAHALSRQAPGAARRICDVRFAPLSVAPRATLSRLLAPSLTRIRTSLDGLYLCGADAEPLPSLSGRAARIAVGHALRA